MANFRAMGISSVIFSLRLLTFKMLRAILQVFWVLSISLLWTPPLWNTAQGQYDVGINANIQLPDLSSLSQLLSDFTATPNSWGAGYYQQQLSLLGMLSGYYEINSAARGFRHFRAGSFGPNLYPEGNLSYQPSPATRTPYTELNPKPGSGAILGTPGGSSGGH